MKPPIRHPLFSRRFGERGVAALEFAFVLPVLLLIAFGLIDFSRVIWWHTTLNYAVQAAARCGAISPTLCKASNGTVSVAGYAAREAYALPVSASNFTVTSSTTICNGLAGVRVQTSGTGVHFTYLFPLFAAYSGPLTASACYPT
ncbi:MAG TPA: TadE/TadG family type IV pilus assembly protein [Stellaceae bacterium]|nr:TadE/TadG family type IV pilus assembly protein [Stellaceae bacterium]